VNIPRFIPADATPAELERMGIAPNQIAPAPAVAPEPTPVAAPPSMTESQAPTAQVATTEPVQPSPAPEGGQPSLIDTPIPLAGELIPPELQTPEERAEVARMAATVDLVFPTIGFIDPIAELEKMLRVVQRMPEDQKIAYPDKVRAAILLHEAGKGPEVSDEDLALAIFIQRTIATPLTEEELEAKATGRKKRSDEPTKPRGKKAQSSADQLKGLLGI
jgi:hypothetical protein